MFGERALSFKCLLKGAGRRCWPPHIGSRAGTWWTAYCLWMQATLLAVLCFFVPVLGVVSLSDVAERDDLELLLQGVESLARPGSALPGQVVVFGEEAFVIASAGGGDSALGVIGATRFGKGRVIAFGHGAFFGDWGVGASEERFMVNAIRWSAAAAKSRQLRVAFLGGGQALHERVADEFSKAKDAGDFSALGKLSKLDVVVWVGGALSDDDVEALTEFVERGGGVLLGVCPWGNQQIWDGQGGGKSIRTDLAQNKFAGPFGLAFGDKTVGESDYELDGPRNARLHSGRSVNAVLEWLAGHDKRAAKISQLAPGDAATQVADLLRALPPGDERFSPRLAGLLKKSSIKEHVPASGRPTLKSDVIGHLGVLFATQAWKDAEPDDVSAAPGADFFPGAVPARARRIEREFTIGEEATRRGGWISTGLYAVAGEPLTVTTDEPSGWNLRIGAHKDTLWHKESWSRWPEITMERAIQADARGAFRMTSPFGGPVYLVPLRNAEPAEFTIEGAVEAPLFVLGDDDSVADWKRRRKAPAPWAELVCNGMVLTVPSGAVRKLKDPVALMEFWERAMKCYPELRGEPQPARAERLVEDIQISVGWMHSGYPVMTHGAEDTRHSAAVALEVLLKEGNWGYFHEFGHNAQKGDWTFGGTTEVTCNLFSLYLGEQMAGIEPWKNSWLEKQMDKPAAHFAAGASFSDWKSKPGLALMMYATVQRDFGWEAFKVAMRAYLDAPETERPKSDSEKRDRWLQRLSSATGRNLGPYFELWGVPTSAAARESVSDLDVWMPAEYGKD